MKKEFIEKNKKKLIAQRNEILETLANRNEQLKKLVETIDSGDEADIASDKIDGTLFNSLTEADQNRLLMISNAIDRINQGTYGFCLSCGEQIPEGRLEAVPYAGLCIKCQEEDDDYNRKNS
ncbi:MAG: TraR/DksA family transcriptional regulator [Spirochaetia bacterium]|nr:TraR/DksA family transcriptional regulator [Spirochaetia bacterium]